MCRGRWSLNDQSWGPALGKSSGRLSPHGQNRLTERITQERVDQSGNGGTITRSQTAIWPGLGIELLSTNRLPSDASMTDRIEVDEPDEPDPRARRPERRLRVAPIVADGFIKWREIATDGPERGRSGGPPACS